MAARRRSCLDNGAAVFLDSSKLAATPPSMSLLALRTGSVDYDNIPRVSARFMRVSQGNMEFASAQSAAGRRIPNRSKNLKKL